MTTDLCGWLMRMPAVVYITKEFKSLFGTWLCLSRPSHRHRAPVVWW